METETIFDLYNKIHSLESKVILLESQLEQSNNKFIEIKSTRPTIPDSKLFSHNLLVRSFAVYGHVLLAGLVLAIIGFIISLILSLIFSGILAATIFQIFGQ